ncbi:GIY-YIG nuclease family protein, partial [Pseudonocardia hydrocarbonoxydans]
VIAGLCADPIRASDVRTHMPAAPGLYAWWASPAVLPTLCGPPHPSATDLRLLYVGIATRLRTRIASNHLGRTGGSTLRRTLAGLLLDEEQYRTRWTDRVVLVDVDERRLTDWMVAHLHVSWCEHLTPRDAEESIIQVLRPPLNVDHASGPALGIVKAARRHYYGSAGPRPAP